MLIIRDDGRMVIKDCYGRKLGVYSANTISDLLSKKSDWIAAFGRMAGVWNSRKTYHETNKNPWCKWVAHRIASWNSRSAATEKCIYYGTQLR